MTSKQQEAGKNPAKDRNSSITRVRPVLEPLFKSKTNGTALLRSLLSLLKPNPSLSDAIKEDPGEILSWCRKKRLYSEKGYTKQPLPGAFEASAPPSGSFLRWLIDHPEELTGDPDSSASGQVREYRHALMGHSGSEQQQNARKLALLNLDASGAAGADKVWWAFEGYSSIDCLVETTKLVLFIEGKRTEPLSEKIIWYPYRNQIARNLECAQQWAAKSNKAFGVLVISEEGKNEEKLSASLSFDNLSKSLPHLSSTETENLIQHYLGNITWRGLVSEWELSEKDHLPESVSHTPYALT